MSSLHECRLTGGYDWPLARLLAIVTAIGLTPASVAEANPSSVADPAVWPAVASPFAPSAEIEARIDRLLARMSVEEKVGQTIMADVASIKPSDLAAYPLGAILNGGDSSPRGFEQAPLSEWLSAADAFYTASRARRGTAIPIIWGTDAVHGHNRVRGATIFPHNIALGATHDPDLMRRIGTATAEEVIVTGQDWTFAPTLAVAQNARWGRTYESYSADPALVATYAPAIIEGLQGSVGPGFLGDGRILATAKHFIGDGGTVDGQDQGDTRVSQADLRDIHGAPYGPAIQAGVQTVMVSYSSWNGQKMHGNASLITEVLKGRLAFDGIVVGDWNGHVQLPGCSKSDCPTAFNAGIDMLMAPDAWKELFVNMVRQVNSGEISKTRLDEAVRRILRVKLRYGLFIKPKPSERPGAGDYGLLGSTAHRNLAREAVRKSLVLLKNDGAILPLPANAKVLVAGGAADDIGAQCGGWTLSWQGSSGHNSDFPNGESIFGGIRNAVEDAGGTVALSSDGSFVERPDVAVVVIGEQPYAETKGDIRDLSYSRAHSESLPLLDRLKRQEIPVVTVFLSGRPLWTTPEIDHSNAFVAAWLPGSEGAGIADLIFRPGDGTVANDFAGRLPFAWPRSPTASAESQPLFPLGFGLRYARPHPAQNVDE